MMIESVDVREDIERGLCAKCGKDVKLGIDGSCKCCHKETCWECWVAAEHECPNCGDFDGKRDTANAEGQGCRASRHTLDPLVRHSDSGGGK